MFAEAEIPDDLTGLECHVCSGTDSLCSSYIDGGTTTKCGEGVSTCLLGKSNDGQQYARGCGLVGNAGNLGCSVGDTFTVCMCETALCNSPDNSNNLFALATTTLFPGQTQESTTTQPVSVDLWSLVQTVLTSSGNSSEEDNSTLSSSNSTEMSVNLASLIISSMPELSTSNMTGKCAFLSDGSEIALNTTVQEYQLNNQDSNGTIAQIDDCSSGRCTATNYMLFVLTLLTAMLCSL